MRKILQNLLISLLSLLLTLVVAEGVIRAMQAANVLPVFNKKAIDKGDTRNKRFNAKLVKSSNPVLYMEFDRNDPNINSAGFRGAEFPSQKTAGVTRIAILGDSVAYGYSVPLEKTFSRLLEQQLNRNGHRAEVLNFAVNGYGTVAELELYKTRVRDYHPDIVLLAYVLNDPLPTAFVVQSVGSAKKQANTFQLLAKYSQLGAWIYLRCQTLLQKLDQKHNYQNMYAKDNPWWQATIQALSHLAEATKADNAKLAVVVFPLLLDFNDYPMQNIHQQIDEILTNDNITHIDLLQDFSAVPYLSLRPHPKDDTHPNAEGHAIAAKKIAQMIEKQFMSPQQ
jgi:lysophospholipase L1-like esterase